MTSATGVAPRGASRTGCLSALFKLALLIATLVLALRYVDQRRAPWAYAEPAERLTVNWVSEFATPNGRKAAMYLDLGSFALRSDNAGLHAWRRGIYGTGRVCGISQTNTQFRIDGAANRSASDVALRTRYERFSDARPSGWHFDRLRGAFRDGALTLQTVLSLGGGAPVTESQRAANEREMSRILHLHFRRGSEDDYTRACRTIGATP